MCIVHEWQPEILISVIYPVETTVKVGEIPFFCQIFLIQSFLHSTNLASAFSKIRPFGRANGILFQLQEHYHAIALLFLSCVQPNR